MKKRKQDQERELSRYLCYLLRHHPETLNLEMDEQGFVEIEQLLEKLNHKSRFSLDRQELYDLAARDEKGRYIFLQNPERIACAQGHSIPFVKPVLESAQPPVVLYHGTTEDSWKQIQESGGISRMKRHAVHMQKDPKAAWKSALRWHKDPVLLQIDAKTMEQDGYRFEKTKNDVWCLPFVPLQYVKRIDYKETPNEDLI